MNTQTEQQTTLRDLIFILFKHKIIIAACLFSVTITVFLIISQKVPEYKATTTLLLKFGRENAFRFVNTQMEQILFGILIKKTV